LGDIVVKKIITSRSIYS